jgi:hypothetical protein
LIFRIPGIYYTHEEYPKIDIPDIYHYNANDYQYPLLDLIEYIIQNCNDINKTYYHKYFYHYHFTKLETNDVATIFQNEINEIFEKAGLLYKINKKIINKYETNFIIERITTFDIINTDIITNVSSVKEKGLRELLEEAVTIFKKPKPDEYKNAVEKLWDAFERLKTYYAKINKDKPNSITKIVKAMSCETPKFEKIFDDEFKALSDIGNELRIRHHETYIIDIIDSRYYDYFFNRCLSLIALAIQYLDDNPSIDSKNDNNAPWL